MATYEPRPIDNSKVELSDELQQLTERLAENAMTTGRGAGWPRAAAGGRRATTPPSGTPPRSHYDELPDAEKHYDRVPRWRRRRDHRARLSDRARRGPR